MVHAWSMHTHSVSVQSVYMYEFSQEHQSCDGAESTAAFRLIGRAKKRLLVSMS